MPVSVVTAEEYAEQNARLDAVERRLTLVEGNGPPPADPGPDPDPGPGAAAVWLSGGNPNINKQETSAQFAAWRGRKDTTALCYPTRDKWETLVSATVGQPGIWTDKTIRLIVQMPFFPVGAYTYAEAAAGKYVQYWKQCAANWKARTDKGFAPPIISAGWEANHNGAGMHYWCGPGGGPQRYTTAKEYVTTFQLFSDTFHAVWPEAEIAWAMNGHDSPGTIAGQYPANDPRNIYPGGAYVQWIGVDYYDHYPPSFGGTTSAKRKDFQAEANDVNGIRWYLNFAKSEGKGFIVPEWAVVSGDDNRGGDNPTYVTNMFGVFREALAAGVNVAECYYDDTAQKMGIMGGQNPKAAAEYVKQIRA